MIQKDGSIVISEFQKGIAKNPIIGNGHIVNADIFETEGLLKISEKVANNTSYDDTPIARTGSIELLENGKIYDNATYKTKPFGLGYDVVEWNGFYIFSGNSGGTGDIWACKTDFTIGTHIRSGLAYKVYLLKSQDGYVYYTNGYKIGRITNLVDGGGFITPTYSDNVLNLPQDENAVSLVELGRNLLIGTESSSINPQYIFQGNIYPWDRTSSSFNLPVKFKEAGIKAMIEKDNLVYIVAGGSGNVYVTNGSSYRLLTKLNFTKAIRNTVTCNVRKNSIAFNRRGNLLIGTSTSTDATPNTTTYHGIWEINTSTGINTLAMTIPSGLIGQTHNLQMGYIYPLWYQILFGYNDDPFGTPTCYSAYTTTGNSAKAIFESQVFVVGDYSNKKSYNELQWAFVTPLSSGQQIKIYYRKGITDSWTSIHESTTDHVGKYSTIAKALIPDVEVFQIKIELLNNTGSNPTPELIRVLIR